MSRVREIKAGAGVRWMGITELCQYVCVGENRARNIGKEAGAVVKIGGRVLYDKAKIDEFMEAQQRQQAIC